jgi:CRP-like cAMP-binding protein
VDVLSLAAMLLGSQKVKLLNHSTKLAARGNTRVSNRLLLRTEQTESGAIVSAAEFVRLKLHQVLHEAGEVVKSVYFPNDGLISILAVQLDGKSVEVGLTGNEGFVGVPIVFGFRTSATTAVTQCDGTAWRIDAGTLRSLLVKAPRFRASLQRYAMILGSQSIQLAACNRLHGLEERLARWLLMSHDRIGNMTMPLTQEFLGQMLGTRRSTVSLAASVLQKRGMITCTRGNVTIIDRRRLEETACDCYSIIQQQSRNWQAEGDNVRYRTMVRA